MPAAAMAFSDRSGVVDRAESAVGDQYERQFMGRHIVDSEIFVGDRHVKPSGSFYQHAVVAPEKLSVASSLSPSSMERPSMRAASCADAG